MYELTGMCVDLNDNYQADETDPFEDDTYFVDFDPRWLSDFESEQKSPQQDHSTDHDNAVLYNINDSKDDPLLWL